MHKSAVIGYRRYGAYVEKDVEHCSNALIDLDRPKVGGPNETAELRVVPTGFHALTFRASHGCYRQRNS